MTGLNFAYYLANMAYEQWPVTILFLFFIISMFDVEEKR